MKVFIVFLAFAIVCSGCMMFADDSNNYVRLQKYLKALAEECAAGGALMFDEEGYKRIQQYVISKEDAQRYADFLYGKGGPSNFKASLYPLAHGKISATVETPYKTSYNKIYVEVKWEADKDCRCIWMPKVVTQGALYEVKQ